MKDVVLTDKGPKPIGPYSQGVVAGGLLFLSGQVAIKPETNEFVSGSIEVQTDQVLKNLMAVLKEAKLGPENVVKATVYLVDLGDFPAMNKVYGQYFADPAPARSTVGVAALPKSAKVEIDLIAVF